MRLHPSAHIGAVPSELVIDVALSLLDFCSKSLDQPPNCLHLFSMLRAQIGFIHRLAFMSPLIFRSAPSHLKNILLQRSQQSIIHSSLCVANTRSFRSTQQQTIKVMGIYSTC